MLEKVMSYAPVSVFFTLENQSIFKTTFITKKMTLYFSMLVVELVLCIRIFVYFGVFFIVASYIQVLSGISETIYYKLS